LCKEGKDLSPTVLCLLRPIVRAIPGKECVSRAVITVEFVILAKPLEGRFCAVHIVWRRGAVFVTEQSKKRTTDSFRQLDGRSRLGARQLGVIVAHTISTPHINRGIDVGDPACGEIGLSSARAEANHADFSVAVALRSQKFDCPRYIAYDLVIRHTARRAC